MKNIRNILTLRLFSAVTIASAAFFLANHQAAAQSQLIGTDFTSPSIGTVSGTTASPSWSTSATYSGSSTDTANLGGMTSGSYSQTTGTPSLLGASLSNGYTGGIFSPNVNSDTSGQPAGTALWTLTIPVTYTFTSVGDSISLSSISFNAYALTGGGTIQGASSIRDDNFTISILNSASTVIATENSGNIVIPSSSTSGVATSLTFGTTLNATNLLSQSGTFYVQVNGNQAGTTLGNHEGVSILALEGSYLAVPEPSTFVLAGIFGLGMLMFFRRRRA